MSSAASTGDDAPKGTRPISPLVKYDGKQYTVACEGAAEILDLHKPEDTTSGKKGATKPQSVFYNPIQQYNRDLSVLAITAFGEDYVAVQEAKRQKKFDQANKSGQRGRKRKRGQPEGGGDGADSAPKKGKNGDRTQSVNGDSTGATSFADVSVSDDKAGVVAAEGTGPGSNGQKETTGTVGITMLAEQDAADHEDKAAATAAGDAGPESDGRTEVSDIPDPGRVAEQGIMDHANGSTTNPETNKDSNAPKTRQTHFRILDALSATGLRALRYAKEISMVTTVTANDLSASATASIKLNVSHNNLSDKIIPTTSDAIQHMHEAASSIPGTPAPYHVIDLDPYGTAAPFLDAAVQAVAVGGLLCVTCTDASVFASIGYLEKTYSQYGGLPLKGAHAHEAGLRLILHAIATSAARYGLAIEPLLSLSIDFYARVFVRIHHSPAEVKFLASKTMIVYNCDSGCGAWSIQHVARARAKIARNGDTFYNFTSALAPSAGTNCQHCDFRTHQAGPMWGGPLQNPYFIQRMLDLLPTLDRTIYGTIPRMEGMLTVALNESLDDEPPGNSSLASSSSSSERPVPPTHPATRSNHPFFFLPSALSRVIHCISPSDAAMRGALLHLGYRTTRSHTKAGSVSTDAPWSVIWEIMREWARQKSPIKEESIKKNTAGWAIMQKDRSKRRLNEAKEAFRRAADNADLDEMSALKTHMEATMYRMTKEDEEGDSGGEGEVESTSHSKEAEKADPAPNTSPKDIHPSKLKIVFDEELGKEPQGKRMVRYQLNPRPDWGPMNRANGN